MRVSVEKLRIWLLAGAVLLVLVVVGFLGAARWKARRILTDLPKKLGADIRQETNGFTWSQTVKGRTVFTLHAAKSIQHLDGKYTLHDVGVAVYGQGQAQNEETDRQKQNERVDRIYGKEFQLDQSTGLVKAVGEVHMDLAAPAAKDAAGKMDYAAGKDLKPGQPTAADSHSDKADQGIHEVGRGDSKLIHVKTSNLVYLQKLGVAATDEPIEFEYNGLTGHAIGAEYNADTGILVLQQAVKVSGVEQGKPVLLTASRAELDRATHNVTLNDAKYLTVDGDNNNAQGRQQVAARHAVVLMREGGGIERINGDGTVTLTAGDSMHVTGDRGELLVNDAGKPESAHIVGNVHYAADDETRHGTGTSKDAKVLFNKQGDAQRITLNGGVSFNERVLVATSTPDGKQSWGNRDLTASVVDMDLSTDAAGKTHPQNAKATGGAKLRVADPAVGSKVAKVSSMAADVLTAKFVVGAAGTSRLDEVKGDGHTVLEQVNETGIDETSTGDSLEVHMRDPGKSKNKGASPVEGGASDIASAVQQGNIVVTRKIPAKGKVPAETDHATAARASYDGDAQALTLNGQVQMSNAESALWAERVVVEQKSGDATADGGVKATYRQSAQSAVVHVLADHAELKKASGMAFFHGTSRAAARLWQGGSQVEAPVLEFNQKQRNLRARGEGAGAAMAVRTVLVSNGSSATGTPTNQPPGFAKSVARHSSVVRVMSREMTYTDATREADFTRGVRVESADGLMRGEHATALLEQPGAKPQQQDASAGLFGGSVDRVIVNGAIEIDQPGRRATGDKLVYTASDGLFVLTGTSSVPPRVVDQDRGVVTGLELRFRSADESVVISNGEKGGSGPRVHTETRVKRDK